MPATDSPRMWRVDSPPSAPSLPAWLWLWTPLAVVAVQIIAKALDGGEHPAWLTGEASVIETLTVLVLVVAVATGLRLFWARAEVRSRLFGPFVLLMAAGCFYFAGEEASWGQHWLGFVPPEAIAQSNDQGEFNLHNNSTLGFLLDQAPRNLLSLAALVGGVIIPLHRRRKCRETVDFGAAGMGGWIWPTRVCLPTCLVALTVSLPDKLFYSKRNLPHLLDFRPGETKEFCLALFLMIYLLSLRRNLTAWSTISGESPLAVQPPVDAHALDSSPARRQHARRRAA